MTSRADPFSWWTALMCALLWGIAVSIADVLTQPVDTLGSAALFDFIIGRLWQWIPTGVVWVLGSKLVAHGRWAAFRAMALLPVALAVSIASMVVSPTDTIRGGTLDNQMAPLIGSIPLLDIAVFLLWTNLFFGGLYVLGYLATRRTARFQQRLASLRLAQSEADMMARETRLSAYRGQLQPTMLLATLAGLRRCYRTDRAGGDRLFDLLISFLRAAMPSVRSGFSTLGAELETVRGYALLRDALGLEGPSWTLDLPDEPPALPFPSLILLPALDDLTALLPAAAEVGLTVKAVTHGVVLRIEADRPASLSTAIAGRLRGGLALTFGSAATLSEGGELPIEIKLRTQLLDECSAAYPRSTGDGDEAISPHRRGDPLAATSDK